MRALAIVGSVARAGERAELPHSDRVALALALARFGGAARACALDAFARGYARAAGFGEVSADLDAELGAAEVVLVGRGACGERGDAFPAQLAERFGAALAYEVIDARPDAHAHALAVERDLSRGARDRLAIAGRAVLAIAESAPRARYVSRHRIDAAHRAPDERAGRDECVARHERAGRDEHIEGGDHIERGQRGRSDECGERMAGANDWRPVTPRVRLRDAATRMAGPAVERMNALFGIRAGGAEPTGSVVRGSADECARQLIRYLGRHGFIERALAEQGESVSPESARARAPSRAHIAGVAVAQRGATAFGAERGSDAASASAAARDTADARPLSARVRRRPRPVAPGVRAVRGPFELGVDIA